MPTTVDIQVTVTPAGGTASTSYLNTSVTGIDDLNVDIDANAIDQAVAIQPGPASAISFILIAPSAVGATISYKSVLGGLSLPLTSTHLYSGPGMAGLLGANPTTLYFSNPEANPFPLRIIVGRTA